MEAKKSWKLEYEIPPLRAIYFCMVDDAESEEHVKAFISATKPQWKIRKIEPALPQGEKRDGSEK